MLKIGTRAYFTYISKQQSDFAKILFSLNFSSIKFCKNKTLTKIWIFTVFINSCARFGLFHFVIISNAVGFTFKLEFHTWFESSHLDCEFFRLQGLVVSMKICIPVTDMVMTLHVHAKSVM